MNAEDLILQLNDEAIRFDVSQFDDFIYTFCGDWQFQIDRFAPSSKTCSICGGYKKDLKLSDRVYICSSCGVEIDRDLNAAINIVRWASPEFTLVDNLIVDFADPFEYNLNGSVVNGLNETRTEIYN